MNEREIFAEVLDKSPAEQSSYLDKACGDDTRLRERIDILLRSHKDAGSFLEKPPAEFMPTITTGEFDTVDEGAGNISLDFLEPSDKPGCLGTLGQYHVIEVVGRGGMGLVLRAHDTKLDRVVAIKVMAPELAANTMAVKRFLREARAAAAVSHNHVVTIHAIDEENRPPFIVMECVDGPSLQEKIDSQGALELKEILRIGMQTAAGLAAAHKQGLVHRDIKPANILLENGVERVKITDFGLARAVDDMGITQTGQIAGTPQYMSPEQAQGQPVDARTDLFSLGSVMYTMCTGRPAFRADNAVAVLRRVADDDPRPIREVNVDMPDWLEAIVDKLLAKNADDRFESAEEVSELFGQHLAHLQYPTVADKPRAVVPPKHEPKPPRYSSMLDTPNRSEGFKRFSKYLTFGLLLLGGIMTAAAVIYVKTDNGKLEIRSPGGTHVKVVIRQVGELIEIYDDKNKQTPFVRLRSGQYELELEQDDTKQFYLSKDRLVVRRGEREIVEIRHIDQVPFDSTAPASPQLQPVEITEVRQLQRHSDPIQDIALARDGKHLISAGAGTILVWDAEKFEVIQSLKAERLRTRAIAVSPDGTRLASGGHDGWLEIWDLKTGKRQSQHDLAMEWIEYMDWSPDGKSIVIKCLRNPDGGYAVWDVERRQVVRSLEQVGQALRFSPDGKWVAGGDRNGIITIFDFATGRIHRQITHAQAKRGRALAFSADSGQLLTGGDDPMVKLWDVPSGNLVATFEYGAAVHAGAFLSDGRHFITASKDVRNMKLWELTTKKVIAEVDDVHVAEEGLLLSPDGHYVVTAPNQYQLPSEPGAPGVIQIWQLPASVWPKAENQITEVRRFEGSLQAVTDLVWLPDGRRVAAASGQSLRVWNAESGEQLMHLVDKLPADSPAVDEEGRMLGISSAFSLGVSADGRLAATGHYNGVVCVWDLVDGRQTRRFSAHWGGDQHKSAVYEVAFTPDGKHLMSAGTDGTVSFWDLANGQRTEQYEYDNERIRAAALSPNGRLVLVGTLQDSLTLTNRDTGQPLRQFPHRGAVLSVKFSADGRLAITGEGGGDERAKPGRLRSVRVWEVATGKLLHEWKGHTMPVECVAFSPDGRFIASGSMDRAIRIWDVASGQVVAQVTTDTHVTNNVAYSPDGKHLISGAGQFWNLESNKMEPDGDFAVRLWRLPESVWPQPKTQD